MNLVLEEDGVLGGVVVALSAMGSHILALRKSEPSLEDVFVELVGRGFADDVADRGHGRGRLTVSLYEFRATESPQAAADWTRRQIVMTDLRSVGGRAYPRISGMLREPSWVFFEILLPFLATSAFVFVYRALQAPPQYVGFVVLGGALTAFWLNVVWMMAGQLYWEKAQGNLELFFAAPMGFMAILFGMALGGMVMSSTRAIVVLVVASLVYGVTFEVDQWFLLVTVFLLTLAALYGLGMIMAALYLVWGREAFELNQLFVEPVYFVSGLELPGHEPRAHRGAGHRDDPAGRRPGRDAATRVRRVAVPGRHAIGRGGDPHPHRDVDRVHPGRAGHARRASNVGRVATAACPSDGSDHAGGRRPRSSRASPPRSGAASIRRARPIPAAPRSGAGSGPPSASAGRWRRTGRTRSCSSCTRSPSRSRRRSSSS